jgi:hypothetical protein
MFQLKVVGLCWIFVYKMAVRLAERTENFASYATSKFAMK